MDLKTIHPNLSVSGQISVDDIAQLKEAGVQSIICNRPDQEEAHQPVYAEIQQAATHYGLQCYFMPVISGHVPPEKGREFGRLLAELPTPIHAYCRSGTRCTILWALSELLEGTDRDTVVQQAAAAGYDLSRML